MPRSRSGGGSFIHAASGLVGAALFLALCPCSGSGQLAWETPRLLGPESPLGFGVHWVRAETLPGDGDAVLVTVALGGLGNGARLRVGAGEGASGELAGFGGIDIRRPLARHGPDQPLDLAWSAGVGVGVGDYGMLTVPFALSAGRSWSSGSVWLAPYVSLGVALDLRVGGGAPDQEFEVSPAADLGLDLALDRRRHIVLRVATSLGDRQALAVGVAIGG